MSRDNVKKSIARSEKDNVCDFEILTKHEVRCLLESTREQNSVEATLLRLSLFLGRSIENLLNIDCQFVRIKGHEYLENAGLIKVDRNYPDSHLKLPDFKQSGKSQFGYINVPEEYVLLFEQIKEKVTDPSNLDTCLEKVQKALSKINEEYNTRLTRARICRYFRFFCKDKGISEVRYGLIAAKDIGDHAGSYYTELTNHQLFEVQSCFAAYLQKISEDVKLSLACPGNKSRPWGSKRLPEKSDVSQYFEGLKTMCISNRNNRDLIALCNNYTAYTLGVLQIATGHRPENQAFGPIKHFDTLNGYVFISDKKSGDNHRRVIQLCEIAKQQVLHHIEHLKQMKSLSQGLYPNLFIGIEKMLDMNGSAPLLSFIRNEQFDHENPLELPSSIKNTKLGLVPNFYRHILRTELDKANVQTDLIDWFMGHEANQDHSFSKFSSMSYNDAEFITPHISNLFSDYNISSFQSPLRSW